MNYTDIENFVFDKGTDDEETVINWRVRRRKPQIRCPKCFKFFDLPKDTTIDKEGYLSASIYHFCDDQFQGDDNQQGWAVLAHLVDWGVK